jgi:glucose/arabinose dehydrogenase
VNGVRNTVGLGWDSYGVLWGVENGANEPGRDDLGDNVYLTNPAEELNRFSGPPGIHYGYPYCFSSFLLGNYTPNTQFVSEQFLSEETESIYHDDWCADEQNVCLKRYTELTYQNIQTDAI